MDQQSRIGLFRVLITAAEAFPVLEEEMLDAKREVSCGFRIFDPWTPLQSPRALEIGETWFDLVAHTLSRGVSFSLVLTDFDPVVGPRLHRDTWSSIRALIAAGEASGRPELLHAHASLHPARLGLLPRTLLWPKTVSELRQTAKDVNRKPLRDRVRFMEEAPLFRDRVEWDGEKVTVPAWPIRPLVPATHHQKLAVFDRERLYVGGLDLDERRFDTPEHKRPGEQTWHDVQLLVDGPVAQAAQKHLDTFRSVLVGTRPVEPSPLLRTLSKRRRWSLPFMSPAPVVAELAEAHHRLAGSTEKLIYLETQFFRDRPFAKRLADLGDRNPNLDLIIILPAAPEDVAFNSSNGSDARYGEYLQAQCVDTIRRAFGPRLFLGSPAQRRSVAPNGRATLYGAPLVYLHAKVSIFDGQRAIVSSANLNGRSLKWDTEVGVDIKDAGHAAGLQDRCFTHWLGDDAGPEFYGLTSARQAWNDRARANASKRPEDRIGFLLPYASAPARRFGLNLPGVPEEIV